MLELNQIYHSDLFELCGRLESQSVDMILCDLPYGTTACAWDTVIPFEPMWAAFKRVIKPRGAIVLTASQPFTSALVMSNPKMFRHEWIWEKEQGTNPFNASNAPMKAHEQVEVFAFSGVYYFPQMSTGKPYKGFSSSIATIGEVYSSAQSVHRQNDGTRYPLSTLRFAGEYGLHPTQKPVALFRYLIRTYTQPGELVLDPCVGSGTTALAAREEGRQFICGDLSAEYVDVARKRLAEPYTLSMFNALEGSL